MRDKRLSIFYRYVYGLLFDEGEGVAVFGLAFVVGFIIGFGVVFGFCFGELVCVCVAVGVTFLCVVLLFFIIGLWMVCVLSFVFLGSFVT